MCQLLSSPELLIRLDVQYILPIEGGKKIFQAMMKRLHKRNGTKGMILDHLTHLPPYLFKDTSQFEEVTTFPNERRRKYLCSVRKQNLAVLIQIKREACRVVKLLKIEYHELQACCFCLSVSRDLMYSIPDLQPCRGALCLHLCLTPLFVKFLRYLCILNMFVLHSQLNLAPEAVNYSK